MSERIEESRLSPGSRVLVAVAWALVGGPLLWGVFMTLKKAAALFE